MAKIIIKKSLPWFLILGLILGVMVMLSPKNTIGTNQATTTAGVNNKAPVFTAGPAENPASTSTSPTNVGENVTFQATATDKNSDKYYLAICKEDSITPGSNSAPTCGGSGSWCISSETNSGVQASCNYTALQGDASSNNWYAFVCDKNASGLCSSSSQGSGDSGSPFNVNHRPSFTVFSDNSPKNPGETVTFTTTASDSDSDNVTLYVCKTAAFSGTCTGGEWCHSSASASDPSCQTNLGTPLQDKNYEAYGYIIDSHNLAASGGSQGTDSILTVSNVAPSISASSIYLLDTDESGDLTLTVAESETTGFKVKFTVVDNNSCLNSSSSPEIVSALINVRMSEITQTGCDAEGEYNANNCYPDAKTGWDPVCVQDSGSCSGSTDSDATWTCTFPLKFYADPTVTDSQKAAYNWVAAVKATDDNSADTGLVDSTTYSNEMGMFLAYDLTTTSIAYGSLDPGADSSEKTTTLKATGNVGLDETLYGVDMSSGSDTIAVSQQHYNLSSGLGWGNGTALGYTPGVEVELNCPKTTTDTPATKNTYWVLRVPDPQAAGSYSGTNTISGVTGESSGW